MNTEINNLENVLRLVTDLNTISQSTYPTDANIEFMERQVVQAISTMISNNRDRAYSQSIYADNVRRAISTRHVSVRRRRRIRQASPLETTPLLTPQGQATPLEKSVVIAKKKLEEPCPTECAICQEIPKFKDAVCTDCSHYYCKACWADWMNASGSNRSCPTCRKNMPKTTIYRARGSPNPGPLTQTDSHPLVVR
jgi:hypothetical protein